MSGGDLVFFFFKHLFIKGGGESFFFSNWEKKQKSRVCDFYGTNYWPLLAMLWA